MKFVKRSRPTEKCGQVGITKMLGISYIDLVRWKTGDNYGD